MHIEKRQRIKNASATYAARKLQVSTSNKDVWVDSSTNTKFAMGQAHCAASMTKIQFV
jgi:hypothetical protein